MRLTVDGRAISAPLTRPRPNRVWTRLLALLARADLQRLRARAVELAEVFLSLVGIDSLRSLAASQPAGIATGVRTAFLPFHLDAMVSRRGGRALLLPNKPNKSKPKKQKTEPAAPAAQ